MLQKPAADVFYRPRIYLSVSIFDNLVTHALVLSSGFNATIFAYGQTSSGKTHTMMGNAQVRFPFIFIIYYRLDISLAMYCTITCNVLYLELSPLLDLAEKIKYI